MICCQLDLHEDTAAQFNEMQFYKMHWTLSFGKYQPLYLVADELILYKLSYVSKLNLIQPKRQSVTRKNTAKIDIAHPMEYAHGMDKSGLAYICA